MAVRGAALPRGLRHDSSEVLTRAGQDLPLVSFRVLATFPHDPEAFTQGLAVHDGGVLEGTGIEGASELRSVDLGTGPRSARRWP